MATQNQGNSNKVYTTLAYDNPTYETRQSYTLTVAAGGSATSTKFYAWTQLVVYGFTAVTTAVGTSTYTVNGTATTSSSTLYALFAANTNTTGTSVTLATTTVGAATGPFVIGGTGAPGTNVNVQGLGGYVQGYARYSINTLGGTNTTMPWGTTTYTSGYAGGNAAGGGGLYMNPGDLLTFVSGTDSTWAGTVIVEYSVLPVTGTVLA
jgi:hypothetical protein